MEKGMGACDLGQAWAICAVIADSCQNHMDEQWAESQKERGLEQWKQQMFTIESKNENHEVVEN